MCLIYAHGTVLRNQGTSFIISTNFLKLKQPDLS